LLGFSVRLDETGETSGVPLRVPATYITDIARRGKEKVVGLALNHEQTQGSGAPGQFCEDRSAKRLHDVANLSEALGVSNQPNGRRLLCAF